MANLTIEIPNYGYVAPDGGDAINQGPPAEPDRAQAEDSILGWRRLPRVGLSKLVFSAFKVHWVSRGVMIGCFSLGLGGCLSHHCFYTAMAGRSIGSQFDQERTRLLGNSLALFVEVTLVMSVDIALTSWLFLCLSTRPVTMKCLDAAYSSASSLLFLFNKEMYLTLPDVAVLSLFIAVLTIPTAMLTPGTLSVEQSLSTFTNTTNVSMPAISSPVFELTTYYHYSRQRYGYHAADKYTFAWESARTILWRILTSGAANGEILKITAPAVNASYQVQFSGPYVTCAEADPGAIVIMNGFMNQPQTKAIHGVLVETAYLAYVPDLSMDRYGQPQQRDLNISRASNQLWMAFKTNGTDGAGWDTTVYPKCPETSYRICTLQNATYNVAIAFENSEQHITYNVSDLTPVPYPPATVDIRKPEEVAKLTFASYYWVFSSLLTGSLALYADDPKNKSGRWYNSIETDMRKISLLGSKDLNCFFAYDWMYYNVTWRAPNNQRLQDINFAHHGAPLDLLVPELSANLTLSLMSNSDLSPGFPTAVQITTSISVYKYNCRTLLISYSMAILAVLVANMMGWVAFKRNQVCMDKSFTVTVIATRHMRGLLRWGSVHYPRGAHNTYLMFRKLYEPPEGPAEWGFEVLTPAEVVSLMRKSWIWRFWKQEHG